MFLTKNHEQTILEISKGDYIATSVEAFLIDRQASELSKHTLEFYWHILNPFIEYCNASSIKFIGEITPDLLRHYFVAYAESHNPGGVHAAYRTLRAFLRWLINEEVMPPNWKNLMLKIKAPKVLIDPLEPISIADVRALLNSCKTLERLTYDGLRQLLQRRSKLAGLRKEPTLHDFRRQFALSMLNNGTDIFSLQRLMGHSDISVLRRYLAQTTEDIRIGHGNGSPVENYSWT